MSDDDMRFSDAQMILLQKKVDNHIEEFHHHMDDYNHHVKEEANRWDHLLEITAENNASIQLLAESSKRTADSTRDIVEVWSNAQSVMKVGSALGTFGKWLASLTVLGVAFKWLADHL